MGDGRAAPGCGNLRQKRPLRKRKRKGGVEAEGRAEGSHDRRRRHLPCVLAWMRDMLRRAKEKSRGERAENGANRSMICSTNSSLSTPSRILQSSSTNPPSWLSTAYRSHSSHFTSSLLPPTNSPQIIPRSIHLACNILF